MNPVAGTSLNHQEHIVSIAPDDAIQVVQPQLDGPPKADPTGTAKCNKSHLPAKESNGHGDQKMMVIMLTTACIINCGVLGIGLTYLRVQLNKKLQALNESGLEVPKSIYGSFKVLLFTDAHRPEGNVLLKPTTVAGLIVKKRKLRTQWTSRVGLFQGREKTPYRTEQTPEWRPRGYHWV